VASEVEKYPHGTQVFNTRVSSFYFFLWVLLSRVLFFPSTSSFFDAVDLKTRSSNRPPNVQSSNQPNRLTQRSIISQPYHLFVLPLFFGAPDRAYSDLFFLCSSSDRSSFVLLQIVLPLFFFRYDVLQVQKSSIRDLILLFGTRVSKTRDLCGIIPPTYQVRIESLTLEF